jgi:ribosomal-protein-alanine N-acetyltransferase
MDALKFRRMIKADLATVVKIENDCQLHPWSLMQFLEGMDAGHSGWVVNREYEGNEVMVGFAVVSTVLDESTLLNICVRPAFQNQGAGRRVIEFLLKNAAVERVRKYFLEVRASNRIAIRLYEGLGFRQLSVRKSYYPAVVGREDGLVYGFEVSSPESP